MFMQTATSPPPRCPWSSRANEGGGGGEEDGDRECPPLEADQTPAQICQGPGERDWQN